MYKSRKYRPKPGGTTRCSICGVVRRPEEITMHDKSCIEHLQCVRCSKIRICSRENPPMEVNCPICRIAKWYEDYQEPHPQPSNRKLQIELTVRHGKPGSDESDAEVEAGLTSHRRLRQRRVATISNDGRAGQLPSVGTSKPPPQTKTQKNKIGFKPRPHRVPGSFKCRKCKRGFCDKYRLQRHMLSHSKVRPFKCSICKMRFLFKFGLTHHKKVHSDERPFACNDCPQKFKRADALRDHMSIHTGTFTQNNF